MKIIIIIRDSYIVLNLEALSALQINTVFLTVKGLRQSATEAHIY